ncbi:MULTISPECIES: hypothetical protein [unclassified Streptomyces]|uniref:hypothetical protein n=1 Tax=unclassified Streptomyces TaxID=2593676 RepID=UPI003D71B8E3
MEITAIVIIGLLLYTANDFRAARVERRLARVERKIDLMLGHLGLEAVPRLDEVAALARDGRQIEAIKLYRKLTDAGLKEAKDAVERMVP